MQTFPLLARCSQAWAREPLNLSMRTFKTQLGWLVAWGLCGCMLSRFSTVWLLPFTLLNLPNLCAPSRLNTGHGLLPYDSGNYSCVCHTEKAQNAWHRRGTQKTGKTDNQPHRPLPPAGHVHLVWMPPSTDTAHRPSTKHYRKGCPGDA